MNDPSDRAYVQSLCKAILGRAGAAEIASWVGAMAGGMTGPEAAAAIDNSPERRGDRVAAYYREFLHRATDPMAADWVDDLINGMSEQQVVEGILDSPGYQSAHADPSLPVRDLYLDVLGRRASADEVAGGRAALASGMGAAAYVADLVEGPEASDQLVGSFYAAGLRRRGEPGTSDPWTAMLAAKVAVRDVVAGIVSSNEFVGKSTTATS